MFISLEIESHQEKALSSPKKSFGKQVIAVTMARTPCCEKMGLKKGPWTPEEDQILISYIQRYGHGNWRALPKQAGLLRCGKSCRLRWINYLRPDIKRGKFSKEEEETILRLHQILGNRWSAIAARLPGRTDNEIKNFWHTHLKKRLERCEVYNNGSGSAASASWHTQASSSAQSVVATEASSGVKKCSVIVNANDGLASRNSYGGWGDPGFIHSRDTSTLDSGETITMSMGSHSCNNNNNNNKVIMGEEMEFWYNLLVKAGQPSQGHANLGHIA